MSRDVDKLADINPPPYEQRAVALDPEKLYIAVDRVRRDRRMSMRAVCRQIGTKTPSTITRIGHGGSVSADTLMMLMTWMGETDITPYIRRLT